MSKLIEIDLHPDRRTLRQFGFIALGGFGFLAAIAWFEVLIFSFGLGDLRMGFVSVFAGLAAVAAFFSLVAPQANLPLYVGLTVLTYPIGFVLSYVIMGTLFYLLIGPMALVMRLIGRDPLNRALDPAASSYWVDARPARPKEHYFRQF